MATITRTITNNLTTNLDLFVPGYNTIKPQVVIAPSATVDLFTVLTGDELEAIQNQLVPLVAAGSITVNATVNTSTFNPVGGGSGGISALTGDVTASGTGSVAATVHSAGTGTGAFAAGAVSAQSLITTVQPFAMYPSVDAVNAIGITAADGTTSIVSYDTQDRRVGFFTKTPSSNGFEPCVEISGDLKCDNYLDMGGHNAACLINMVNPFAGLGVSAMTTAQMNAITPNRAGNIVFVTDSTPAALFVNDGTTWKMITAV